MPQFTMPLETAKQTAAFQSLPEFTQGYLEAAFFTIDEELTFGHLHKSTLASFSKDCDAFVSAHSHLIQSACEVEPSYSERRAGHDFWYTRNGHGTGFWDRGLHQIGRDLSDAAKTFPEVNLYQGDDGKLHA